MRKYIFLFLLWVFALPWPAGARVMLDIQNPAFAQVPIILPQWKSVDKTPPALTAKVYEILTNDLTLSGYFRVVDYRRLPPSLQGREGIPGAVSLHEWIPAGGEFLLAGEASLESDGLNVKLRFHLIDLVEKKPLVGKQYEGHLQSLRTMVHRMADEVVLQFTGEKGIHTTKIAYVSLQTGNKEIYIADVDGANIKQITQNQSINLSPVWSPDGKRIAFTSYLKRNPDLYLISVDGKEVRRFSFSPGLNASPSWSPDGKQIVLMMGVEGKSDIFIVDANGDNPKRLTKGHGNEASPSWAPDGKRIAFVSDRSGTPQVYTMAPDGSDVRRLTYEGNYNTNPSWSPKGDRIAFCGRTGGHFQIFTIRNDGSGVQRLTNSGDNENPTWSPDGRYIAFSSTQLGSSRIFMMNANGFNQRPITQTKGGESSPSWSRRFA